MTPSAIANVANRTSGSVETTYIYHHSSHCNHLVAAVESLVAENLAVDCLLAESLAECLAVAVTVKGSSCLLLPIAVVFTYDSICYS